MKKIYLMVVVGAMLQAGCHSRKAAMEYEEVKDSLQQNARQTMVSEEIFSGIYLNNMETAKGRIDFSDSIGKIQILPDGSVHMAGVKSVKGRGLAVASASKDLYAKSDSSLVESEVRMGLATMEQKVEPAKSENHGKLFFAAVAMAAAAVIMLMVWRKSKG